MAAPSIAAGAYAATQRLSAVDGARSIVKAGGGGVLDGAFASFRPGGVPVPGAPDGAFSQMLQTAVQAVGKSGKAADSQSMAAVSGGNADLVNVVTAVAESEAAIETLVAVRDRVISAYEEIMRMPI